MNYPLISEYVEAIRFAEDNFSTLTNLRPVMENGRPFMSSGNFAVVFKMEDIKTGKIYAVKCFTREEEQRERCYRLISDELNGVNSPYLTSIKYLEKELFVDVSGSAENEFPVLLMDWVEGQTMDAYIRENINDKWELERLCRNFCRMGAWLLEQPFAHGDLKPENIMISADAMPLLVDYDGMYVPAMKGEMARELGSPDYRHPLRTEKDFDEHIDDFPLASIALSLEAISLDPSLLTRYGAADRLLFSATDYADLSKCEALKEVTPLCYDSELQKLSSMLLLASSQGITPSDLRKTLFIMSRKKMDILSTLTLILGKSPEDTWEDEYGVLYSLDRKRLLRCKNKELTEYVVRDGTKEIFDHAFSSCFSLRSIKFPDSLISIEDDAFGGCTIISSINLPESLSSIGNLAFMGCRNLLYINIPDSLVSIGYSAFYGCDKLSSIMLPKKLRVIKGNPFEGCRIHISNKSPYFKIENDLLIQGKSVICVSGGESPEKIIIPPYITHIGRSAFKGCEDITLIELPDSLTSIEDDAFYGCEGLTTITLPKDLREIKGNPFSHCKLNISSKSPYLIVENDLLIQDKSIICVSGNPKTITIPSYITHIGKNAFERCEKITSIKFPDSLTFIGDNSFNGCENLTSIELPNSVTSIGNGAFKNCKMLTSITMSESIEKFGYGIFEHCDKVKKFRIIRSTNSNLFSIKKKFKKFLPTNLRNKIKVVRKIN